MKKQSFSDELSAQYAFRFFKDIGAPDDLSTVADYMKTDVDTIERWKLTFKWDKRLHEMLTGYNAMAIDQGLREEMLKNIGIVSRGLEQYLMTMFERDEVTGEYNVDENGELVLVNYLKIGKVSDLTAAVKAFKNISELKLSVVGGVITEGEQSIMARIILDREEKGWDVYRTMRECETKIGKIPEFLRIEASNKKEDDNGDHGDTSINIQMPPGVEKYVEQAKIKKVTRNLPVTILNRHK